MVGVFCAGDGLAGGQVGGHECKKLRMAIVDRDRDLGRQRIAQRDNIRSHFGNRRQVGRLVIGKIDAEYVKVLVAADVVRLHRTPWGPQ